MSTVRAGIILVLAAVAVFAAPQAHAGSNRVEIRAGYDTDPEGATDPGDGDAWAGLTLGRTMTGNQEGRLSLWLDLSLGATAYERLADLNQIFLAAAPSLTYVVSPRVSATLSAGIDGRLVRDDGHDAWAWGGSFRVREQLAAWADLAEYVSYRSVEARDTAWSGTSVAAGAYLRMLVGERWTLGAGGEYGSSDGFEGEAGAEVMPVAAHQPGTGNGYGNGTGGSPILQGVGGGMGYRAGGGRTSSSERISGSLGLGFAWSAAWSTGVEYLYTHTLDGEGENLHSLVVGTTFAF